ncbi:MAG: hypothetical protein H5U32_02415 [Pseudomonas balearica]|uniref:hypothetical protein n=1 Tax=Stutzerimonas balearica TaxID=74829 RepID=UPI0019984D33|nr:hypothetical protein [Stutzerimonas balearica]MBC7198081.1 hypothetical protein [Stutzerimonas balearica]
MLTTIPFSGFYQSFHDSSLDDALDQMFSDRDTGCWVNHKLRDRAFGACQWGLVHGNYAAAYAKALADEFKIALTFESLKSPREYNFDTDRIFCEIELDEVKRIRAETSEKALRDKVRERFTPCDGFIPFYSANLDNWDEIETWDHNEVGTLIEAYVDEQAPGFDMWAEYDLMESARANGRLDEWIIQATPDIGRLFTIHDYLQERAA